MSRLSRALHAAATLPARLYSAAAALRGPTVPAAYHREQTAILEERVQIAEDARDAAEGNLERARRDRAADVRRLEAMVRACGAHPENGRRLICQHCKMTAFNVCIHIANAIDVAEEEARDAERARDEALAALDASDTELRALRAGGTEQAGALLDAIDGLAEGRDVDTEISTIATFEIDVAPLEKLAAEVASLRARRAHLDAGPVVRRSAVDGLFPGAMVADEDR